MKLREIAHSRTGDKGNISVISVIAYKPEDFDRIRQSVTAEAVAAYFMEDALGGGVTRSLAVDMHGKTLGFALLEMEI